jgi:hypothetical protein
MNETLLDALQTPREEMLLAGLSRAPGYGRSMVLEAPGIVGRQDTNRTVPVPDPPLPLVEPTESEPPRIRNDEQAWETQGNPGQSLPLTTGAESEPPRAKGGYRFQAYKFQEVETPKPNAGWWAGAMANTLGAIEEYIVKPTSQPLSTVMDGLSATSHVLGQTLGLVSKDQPWSAPSQLLTSEIQPLAKPSPSSLPGSELATTLKKAGVPAATFEVAGGVDDFMAGLGNFMLNTPLGWITSATGASGSTQAHQALTAGFLVDMAKILPDSVEEIIHAFKAKDTRRATVATLNGLMAAGVVGGGAAKLGAERAGLGPMKFVPMQAPAPDTLSGLRTMPEEGAVGYDIRAFGERPAEPAPRPSPPDPLPSELDYGAGGEMPRDMGVWTVPEKSAIGDQPSAIAKPPAPRPTTPEPLPPPPSPPEPPSSELPLPPAERRVPSVSEQSARLEVGGQPSAIESPAPAKPPATPPPPVPVKPATSAPAKAVTAAPTINKKLKAQKEYLVEALQQAVKEAPEELPAAAVLTEPAADRAAYRGLEDLRTKDIPNFSYNIKTEESNALWAEHAAKWEPQFEPLFAKYGIPTKDVSSARYKTMAGEVRQEYEGKPLGFAERRQRLEVAMDAAHTAFLPHIEIEVPGDGTFRIINTKPRLKEFLQTAAKQFPSTAATYRAPTLGSTAAKPVPAVSPKPKAAEVIKAVEGFASEEPTRVVLHSAYSNGKELVATDGRRLIRVIGDFGGTPEEPVFIKGGKLDANGPQEVRYPIYAQVIPKARTLIAGGVDTAETIRLLRLAEYATSEKANSVRIYRNKDGSIGVSSGNPDFGDYEGNMKEGNALIGAFNPGYLVQALDASRRLGDGKVDFYTSDPSSVELAPLVIRGAEHEHVLMPFRLSDAGPAPASSGYADVVKMAARDRPTHKGPLPEPTEVPEPTRTPLTDSGEVKGSGNHFTKEWNVEVNATDIAMAWRRAGSKENFETAKIDRAEWPKTIKEQNDLVRRNLGWQEGKLEKGDAAQATAEIGAFTKAIKRLIERDEARQIKAGKRKPAPRPSPPASPSPPGTSAVGFPAAAAPAPPIHGPPAGPGYTMIQGGRLPVTMTRTSGGSVSVPQIMGALEQVQRVAGTLAGNIRTGRFFQQFVGIFKPHEEIIRLKSADNIPTAVHEVGHALQKQFYGTFRAGGLRGVPSVVRRELVGMGKALYGTRKPVAGYSGEGFAEFMRYWLTTDDAARVAPETTRFFERTVLPAHPEVAKSLASARDLVTIWRHQGAQERMKRQVEREPGAFSRIAKALAQFVGYQGMFEGGAPIEAVSKEAARKLGRPLSPAEDPFQIYSWKRGSAGAVVERMANEAMLDVWGNPVGPSLAEALAPVRGKRQEFLLYLFARRALERWSKGKNPGVSAEDAQHIKTLYDSPEFNLVADKYYQWWDGLLNYLVQADPAMADMAAAIRAGSYDYAPLARMIDPLKAKRAAAVASSNPLMRMFGSGLPVKDIFDQTFIGAARLVNRAHRAMVTNAIVKLASVEGLGHIIEEVPKERVREQLNIELIRRELESMGVDTSGIPDDTVMTYYTPASKPRGTDPIIVVQRPGGVRQWYHVDPRLYETLDGLQAFSLKNAFPGLPALGTILDLMLGAPARAFRLGTTGLRPAFSLVTNPLRDVAAMVVQTRAGNPARTLAEFPAAMLGVLKQSLGGKGDWGTEAFYNLGAHMGQPLGLDISHTRRVSNELFHGRFMRVVRNPVDHLRQLLGIPEAAPRVAELRAVAKELGYTPGTPMTPDQAVAMALAAKRITVDFSAAGDYGRIINQAVPFYNPALQGLRIFGRALHDHPARSVLLGLAAFTAPALLNWWNNKDKEWYRAMPWRERYLYNNIDDGQNVWQIPRPFEWGNAFQVVPEAIADSWYRQDPEGAKAALGQIFATTNPGGWPVLPKLAKEQWQNRIDFWDRPIVPRSEIDLPPNMQVGPYTSRLSKAIGHAFPQVSPRRVDAAIRGYFGGVAPDVMTALGLGASHQDRDWEMSDTPVLGVLWRRGGQFNAQNQHIADFYDTYLPAVAQQAGERRQMKLEAEGTRKEPAPEPSPGVWMAARIGEKYGAQIRLLVTLANQARDPKARGSLYRDAGVMAQEATEQMKAALREPK